MDLRNRRSLARGGYSSETFCTAGATSAHDVGERQGRVVGRHDPYLPGDAPRTCARAMFTDSRNEITIRMGLVYAEACYTDPSATLDDLREAVTTLEDTTRTARRVLGGAHPTAAEVEKCLQEARAALRARETPSPSNNA